jgi:S-adenosylmethionine-diacylglycerol 3-amino-3-carboxypropyl transferase
MKLADWLSKAWFRWVHGHHLVYNTCWEDPRLDHEALRLGPDDTVVMITSAGCNALDYALAGPRAIHAVDLNPRQNALLELKIAGIQALEHDTFFELFGHGYCRHAREIYRLRLRRLLRPLSRCYWDKYIRHFCSPRGSFYFHGTTGTLAWMVNSYIDRVLGIRAAVQRLLDASGLAEQQAIYGRELHARFWKGFLRWLMNRDVSLAMLGVPRAQRRQVEATYPGGIAGFIEHRVAAVFTQLPLADNYFWRVYLTGSYTPTCCPEYLRPDNFARLKAGLVDRVHVTTSSLLNFLAQHPGGITGFVLLDHMDWLSSHLRPVLHQEWQAIVDKAAPGARLLWRSGATQVDYVDDIPIRVGGVRERLGDLLVYHRELAEQLHRIDRVHTYGSFTIADLSKA